jgi:hypothetical protein
VRASVSSGLSEPDEAGVAALAKSEPELDFWLWIESVTSGAKSKLGLVSKNNLFYSLRDGPLPSLSVNRDKKSRASYTKRGYSQFS